MNTICILFCRICTLQIILYSYLPPKKNICSTLTHQILHTQIYLNQLYIKYNTLHTLWCKQEPSTEHYILKTTDSTDTTIQSPVPSLLPIGHHQQIKCKKAFQEMFWLYITAINNVTVSVSSSEYFLNSCVCIIFNFLSLNILTRWKYQAAQMLPC